MIPFSYTDDTSDSAVGHEAPPILQPEANRTGTDHGTTREEPILAIPARWPDRLVAAIVAFQHATLPSHRAAARAEVWTLLGLALLKALRRQARFDRRFSPEDLEDLASSKTMELMIRLENNLWDPCDWEGRRLSGLLKATARNGLIDLSRRAERKRRQEPVKNEEEDEIPDPEWLTDLTRASDPVEQQEFAEALAKCALALPEKSRRVWFLRVFYGMPTKAIAAHPGVQLREGHVDVLLQRARQTIGANMIERGFHPRTMPSGTFVVLWERLQVERW